MTKLKTVSLIVGALAGLTAVIGLAISVAQISSGYRDERTKKWQSVAIFSHIEQAGESGLTFDQLRSKYLDSVQQFSEFDLPKNQISDETLRWIILDLVSRRAIAPLPGSKYKVNFEPAMFRDPMAELAPKLYRVSERALFYATTEPKKYNVPQLVQKLSAEFSDVTPIQIRMVVTNGISVGALKTDEQGNIYAPDGRVSSPELANHAVNRSGRRRIFLNP